MSEVDRLYVVFDANGKPYVKGLKDIERQTKTTGGTLESTFRAAGKAAGMAIAAGLVVGTAAVVSVGTASVKAAAQFEYEMARVKAVSSATGAEMAGMSKLALQLGKDTVFSAGEAAKGIYALATAGVSVADIMGGAAAAALDLAAAGELDVGRGAEIAAAAMNIFELKGKDVVAVADALAVGATKSAVEVSDMADAFNMSAAVAAQAGMSVQELTAAIALLGNAGIRGSDAGTSLKTMLMMLMAPTEQAADAMEQYGIEIYTASGEMKSLDEIIAELDQSLAGLSQEEANHVKRVIAGQDAIRALNVLTKVGATNYRDMTKEVSRSGAAQDIAAAKMDNLRGSYEQLKGSIETAFIMMGNEGIPGLRSLVDSLTEETNRFITAWERMTGSDAWKRGTYEIRFAMATDMAMGFLEDLAVKARNALVKVDWGTVAGAIVDAIGRALVAAPPFVVEVALDVIKDVATSPSTAKSMLQFGNLGSLVYQWGQGLRDDAAYTRHQNTITGQERQSGADIWGDMMTVVGQYKAGLRELGDEEERAWLRQEKMAHALDQSKEAAAGAAEEMADLAAIEEELAAKAEYLAEVTERLSAVHSGMVDPGQIWQHAEGSLDSYIAAMDEALAAWATYEENLTGLAEEFGQEFGAEVILKAGEIGPEFLAALMGRDDATQRKVMEGLQASLTANIESLAQDVSDLTEPMGEDGAQSFMEAFRHHTKRSSVMSDAIKDALTVDVSAKGREGALSYVKGWITALVGWDPMGGSSSASSFGAARVRSRAWGGPVESYGLGGPVGLPAPQKSTGRAIPIIAHEGEWVLTENQADFLMGGGLRAYADGGEVADPFGSYVSRESARYSAASARAGSYLDMNEILAMSSALARQIEFLTLAIEHAESQLQSAKDAGASADDINDLAASLFSLQSDAAYAREELEDLSRVPLEQALSRWSHEVRQAEALMSIMGSTGGLLTQQLGALGGQYQSYLDLMNDAVDPDEIMRYSRDAIDSVLDMYNESLQTLSGALREATDAVRQEQSAWDAAWGDRLQAVDDAYQAQLKSLDAQAEAVSEKYSEQVDAIYEQQRALRDAWAQQDRADAIGGLKRGHANILAQGYYTEADVRRMDELSEQIAVQEERDRRERQMASLEAQREAKVQEQQEAVEKLEVQRAAAEAAHQAQIAALQAEQTEQMAAFENRLAAAEAAYAQEVEALKLKYADMVQVVIDQETELIGEADNYEDAGRRLGESFAAGLELSIAAVTAAAQAVAQAAADNLQLHSPAKEGPLSSLDSWWTEFPATILKPFDVRPVIGAAMDMTAPALAGGRVERIDIHLSSDGNGVTDQHVESVARRVEQLIDQRYENVRVSWGRRGQ